MTGNGFSLTGGDATNYVLASSTLTTSANIDQRPVTVTADAKSKVFGPADPPLTYQLTSGTVVAGDPFSGALTRTAGEATGSWAILQGTLSSAELRLTYIGASLIIKPWTLTGFYQPVDMPTGGMVWNTIKGGQTVPLKFEVFVGSVERTDVGAVKAFTATPTSCGTPGVDDLVEITTTGGTELRYTGGQFIQNWQTPKSAGTCYRTTMTAQDGSLLIAYFKIEVAPRAASPITSRLVRHHPRHPPRPQAPGGGGVVDGPDVHRTSQPSRRRHEAARRHREPPVAHRHAQQPVARPWERAPEQDRPVELADLPRRGAAGDRAVAERRERRVVLRRHHAALARLLVHQHPVDRALHLRLLDLDQHRHRREGPQHLGQSGNPDALVAARHGAPGVRRVPVSRVRHPQLGQRPGTDRAGEVGGPLERGVVHYHRRAVPREPDVQLERVGPLMHGQLEGGQCVLGRVRRGAAMGDHRPNREIEERVHRHGPVNSRRSARAAKCEART